jgi:hypothetical protein
MNARSTDSGRNARAGLLIVLLAGIFTYGMIRAFSIRFAAGDVYPDYSSIKASPAGTKLLYDSLARTPGLAVSRNFLPLEDSAESNAAILLLAIDAAAFAGNPEPYIDRVERLAGRGNRVVAALHWESDQLPEHATNSPNAGASNSASIRNANGCTSAKRPIGGCSTATARRFSPSTAISRREALFCLRRATISAIARWPRSVM